VQAFRPTERRWNRTIQAWDCHALPVLKTDSKRLRAGLLGAVRQSVRQCGRLAALAPRRDRRALFLSVTAFALKAAA